MRMFIFAVNEGDIMQVWRDPDGSTYREARETGAVLEYHQSVPTNVNWIASAVIDDDYDFTLQAPRETR